ncbi:MAG TPA: hypothetical protein VIV88_10950 [Gemmatimonadales bacterium]
MTLLARRSPTVRAAWLLGAALQLALPGAAAWADARLDAVGTHATAHFESHTTKSCARIHPPDCALCHFLSAPTLTGGAIRFRLDVADRRVARPAAPAPFHRATDRLLPPPRAPPALS